MSRNVPLTLSVKLWSTRISSSRQVVGRVGEAFQVFTPCVGSGISAASAGELTVSMGTMFPGKGAWVLGSVGQLLNEPRGSGHKSLKSPSRSAREGTVTLPRLAGTRSLRHSCDQKKKVLL